MVFFIPISEGSKFGARIDIDSKGKKYSILKTTEPEQSDYRVPANAEGLKQMLTWCTERGSTEVYWLAINVLIHACLQDSYILELNTLRDSPFGGN